MVYYYWDIVAVVDSTVVVVDDNKEIVDHEKSRHTYYLLNDIVSWNQYFQYCSLLVDIDYEVCSDESMVNNYLSAVLAVMA